MLPQLPLILAAFASAVIASAVLTWTAIGYARRRALIDHPGRRRSHALPTARGGGVGIALCMLAATAALAATQALPAALSVAFIFALALVSVIGWIDDHRPLPALLRLGVHLLAAGIVVSQSTLPQSDLSRLSLWMALIVQLVLLVSAVNVWNFMDGINGLVSSQSAWIAACLCLAFGLHGQWSWCLLSAILGGACIGFLPFNFPHARIFLGDVGSGALGLVCAVLMLQAALTGVLGMWSLMLLASPLLLDAAPTLASRMLRGRRWYTAHREHLYQWLVRSGHSHAQVTGIYMLWNLIVVLPLILVIEQMPQLAPLLSGAAAVLGLVLWCSVKGLLLRSARLGSAT